MLKISLLVTGRDVDNPEVKVWANGNFLLNWDRVTPILEADEEFLARLKEMRKQYGRHHYTHTNRHRHNNDFPSYWALGYKDLHHMKKEVSAADFAQYLRDHCHMRGCCMPSIAERAQFGLDSN
jgi:hypothetical protein